MCGPGKCYVAGTFFGQDKEMSSYVILDFAELNRLQDKVSDSERYDTFCGQIDRLRRMKNKYLIVFIISIIHVHTHAWHCWLNAITESIVHTVLFNGSQPTMPR